MKKAYRYLAIDLKLCTIVIFLLAGCDSNSPKSNQTTINSAAPKSIARSSSSASSGGVAVSSTTPIIQRISSQRSPIAPIVNKPTSSSRSALVSSSRASSSNQATVAISSTAPIQTPANTLATSTPALKAALVGISGVIKLTGKNGEVLSPEGVIVNLEPTSSTDDVVTSQEKHQHEVQMKDKTYLPKFMTVRKNDQVNFNNKDKIKHNVFSTSAGNGFDLGTYGEGTKNNTVLKTPGIVKVYCNIHPEMAFFISVSPHNYSYITNESGAYEINNLPPGEYKLSAWNIRGEIQQVVNLQTLRTKKDIVINAQSNVTTSHKNKFGEDYKVQPALFKDEFY